MWCCERGEGRAWALDTHLGATLICETNLNSRILSPQSPHQQNRARFLTSQSSGLNEKIFVQYPKVIGVEEITGNVGVLELDGELAWELSCGRLLY